MTFFFNKKQQKQTDNDLAASLEKIKLEIGPFVSLEQFLKDLGFEGIASEALKTKHHNAKTMTDSEAEALAIKLNLPQNEEQRNEAVLLILKEKLRNPILEASLRQRLEKLIIVYNDMSAQKILGLTFCLLTSLAKIHGEIEERKKERLDQVSNARPDHEYRRPGLLPKDFYVIRHQPGPSVAGPSTSQADPPNRVRHFDSKAS